MSSGATSVAAGLRRPSSMAPWRMRAHSSAKPSSSFWSELEKAAGELEKTSRTPVNCALFLSKMGTTRMERIPRRRETAGSGVERDAEIWGKASGGGAANHFIAAGEGEGGGAGTSGFGGADYEFVED